MVSREPVPENDADILKNCRELTLDLVNGKWCIMRNGIILEEFETSTALDKEQPAIERYNQLKRRGKYAK